jgi:trans-aconitate 2-methyltransferase
MTMPTTKPFAGIRADYTFFQNHATEAAADLRAYLPRLEQLTRTRSLRMLDFGCGDGEFTAELLSQAEFNKDELNLSLVEPDDLYRCQALARVQRFSEETVQAWPALPADGGPFDFVLANHVFYYVPELEVMIRAVLDALSPNGIFIAAMAGRRNTLIQFWERCFALIDKPIPFHTAEDFAGTLTRLGEQYEPMDVHYRLTFPDGTENRLSILRFLLGDYFENIPRQPMLSLFDPFTDHGTVTMPLVHEHFAIDRQS